jgi:hypothetical protein
MKTTLKLVLTTIALFLTTNTLMAQRDLNNDPDIPAAPINNYSWVLLTVGVAYGLFILKMYTNSNTQQPCVERSRCAKT